MASVSRLQRHLSELLSYLESNQYAATEMGEPLSTAFVESATNKIVAKRMSKTQQMRWNRMTVQPFLDVRTATLTARSKTPSVRAIQVQPANDNEATATMAQSSLQVCTLFV